MKQTVQLTIEAAGKDDVTLIFAEGPRQSPFKITSGSAKDGSMTLAVSMSSAVACDIVAGLYLLRAEREKANVLAEAGL